MDDIASSFPLFIFLGPPLQKQPLWYAITLQGNGRGRLIVLMCFCLCVTKSGWLKALQRILCCTNSLFWRSTVVSAGQRHRTSLTGSSGLRTSRLEVVFAQRHHHQLIAVLLDTVAEHRFVQKIFVLSE